MTLALAIFLFIVAFVFAGMIAAYYTYVRWRVAHDWNKAWEELDKQEYREHSEDEPEE